MPTTLGVAQEGGRTDGWPFNSLFDRIVPARTLTDVNHIDCLLLWGGTDISPSLYGQNPAPQNEGPALPSKRDLIEWQMVQHCVKNNIPIIGVCRGAQLLCAFDGGKLAQHIDGHMTSHTIVTDAGEIFYAAASHHQMMLPAPGAEIIATSRMPMHDGFYIGEDGIYELIEEDGFLEPEVVYFPKIQALGFQPHPEWESANSPFLKWAVNLVHTQFLA